MAANGNDAASVAAYWESLVQKHKESAEDLANHLKNMLDSNPDWTGAQHDGIVQALSWAQNIAKEAADAGKSGSKDVSPEKLEQAKAATKTIAAEGQPTGAGSVYGQMFNGQQGLTTAGTMALAQALGSKYMIGINGSVNVGKDSGKLGALGAIIKPGLSVAQILTSLMFNQDQGTIQAVQRELVSAGYLDPLHTTNLQLGAVSSVNDPTLQALANLLEASANHKTPVQKILTQGQASGQGKDWANLWDSIVNGQPFTVHGTETNISSAASLTDQLRNTAHGANSGGQGVLSGMAGQNPTDQENADFTQQAQEFQRSHPAQVTTQYEPQPGLGISGFTRFPLQKSQTTVGGADQAAMDQYAYNWVIQNMGSDVAAQGAATVLQAFNQMLGLGAMGTGNAPSSAAGGA